MTVIRRMGGLPAVFVFVLLTDDARDQVEGAVSRDALEPASRRRRRKIVIDARLQDNKRKRHVGSGEESYGCILG